MKHARRQYSDDDKAAALVALDMNGGNLAGTARQLNVPRKTLHEWASGRCVVPEVAELRHLKKGQLVAKLDDILDKLAHGLTDDDKIAKARLTELSTAFGTVFDKRQLLNGAPSIQPSAPPRNMSAEERAQAVVDLLDRVAQRSKLVN